MEYWLALNAMAVCATLGSFLTVLTTRVPRRLRGEAGRVSLGGRSYCPSCDQMIPLYRNIPVLSYVLQKGRASCCEAPIPPGYFLLEAGCAGAALALIALFGLSAQSAAVFLAGYLIVSFGLIARAMRIRPKAGQGADKQCL